MNAAQIFDDVIINDSIPITYMPPVLQTEIFESHDDAVVTFWYNTKESPITPEIPELDHSVNTCNIPTKYELLDTSRDNPLQWNAVQSFTIEFEKKC